MGLARISAARLTEFSVASLACFVLSTDCVAVVFRVLVANAMGAF